MVPVRYRFQWRKTAVGWLQRATWKKRYRGWLKSIVLPQNCKVKSERIIVVLKCKKMFLFEKIEKNVQFNSLFLRIFKTFICVHVKQVVFQSEDWRKLFLWTSVLYTAFALEMHQREAYRKQTGSNVSILLNRPLL